jgi:hypothetical protein
LKNGSVKSDQIFFDQTVSGFQILIDAEAKQRANGIAAIKGQAITISGQYQKQIQQQFVLTHRGQESIGKETMGNKAKAPLNLSYPFGDEYFFTYHVNAFDL